MDLWRMAQDEVRQSGLRMSRAFEHHLRNAITGATLLSDHEPAGADGDLEQKTLQLVRAMIEVGRERGYDELDEAAFYAALDRLLPMFPFLKDATG